MTVLLASLGLGSAAVGNWIKSNKVVFLTFAIFMLSLSLASAIHEKRKWGKNTGLVIFAAAFVISAFLLSYNKIRYGYFL